MLYYIDIFEGLFSVCFYCYKIAVVYNLDWNIELLESEPEVSACSATSPTQLVYWQETMTGALPHFAHFGFVVEGQMKKLH
jgi:hypothetical protein